jgi:hypothetical protein
MQSGTPLVTIVVAGRNDDYGGDFRARLFRSASHNVAMLQQAGVPFEYLLVEWNPLSDRPLLSDEFTRRVPSSRAIVAPSAIHDTYSPTSAMPFHEMPAKNAGLRRARAPWIIVTNADVLFGAEALAGLAAGNLDPRRLYRARRVDVPANATWEAMQDSRNHLPSGEGRTAPVDYLGAGGDFCLASRELWYEFRGFDERVRFSTRGKDWQFFLSARERGVLIEFVGTVFHLDHDGGFRNTKPEDRLSPSVHFGLPWDIEFGLPTVNGPDWGLSCATSSVATATDRIALLEQAAGSNAPAATDEVQEWLVGAEPDWICAGWLHAIFGAYRARRRLWVKLATARAAARLQGFLPLAQGLGVEVCGRWQWPPLEGYSLTPLSSGPLGGPTRGDWCVTEQGSGLSLTIDGLPALLAPRCRPMTAPAFNPLLARRLLRAWTELHSVGARRVLLYGAGSHTRDLLSFGWPDCQTLAGIVVTDGPDGRFCDLPVTSLNRISARIADAIVLSSASYEPEMLEAARDAGFAHVVPLYSSWPAGLTRARQSDGSLRAGGRR